MVALLQLLGRSALAWVSYYVLSSVYEAFYSPLARQHIPGPFVARFTRGWLTACILSLGKIFRIEALHRRHGDVVRIGPSLVAINHVPTLLAIFNDKRYNKGEFYDAIKLMGTHHAMTRKTDVAHRANRRITSRPFMPANVARFEPELRENAVLYVHRLTREGESGKKGVDVLHLTRIYAMDTLGEICYGERWNIMANPEGDHALSRLMREINVLQGPRALLPAWGFAILEALSPLIPPLAHAFKSERTIMTHAADRITAVKRELVEIPIEQRPRETAVQRLLSTPLSTTGQLLPEDEICADVIAFLFAGSDTVSTTFSYGLWHLATHLDVQDKLYDELKHAIEDREQIPSAVELEKLPYLRGFFLEMLRLYSAAPSHLPRVVPDGGLDVLGYHIPAGTTVAGQAWSVHRQPHIFSDPDELKPERWANGGTAEMKDAMMPFGKGIRICVGHHLATTELKILLAAVVRNHAISLDPACTPASMKIQEVFLLNPAAHAVPLRFTPRQH